MSQPSGQHWRRCPICGMDYLKTNWMVRRGVTGKNGRALSDTHMISCDKKQAEVVSQQVEKPQ